jgi:hypothetical protein
MTTLAGLLVLIAAAALPSTGHAQSAEPVELTVFIGARAGGGFQDEVSATELEIEPSASFGLMLDFPWETGTQLEIYLSRQSTDVEAENAVPGSPDFGLNIEYYHIGGTVMLDKVRDLETYLVATVGATRFDPSGSSLESEIRGSLSIGLGAKYPVSERLKLRMEGRVFVTAMDSDSSIFCNLPGSCLINVESDTLIQWEASLGLTFAF